MEEFKKNKNINIPKKLSLKIINDKKNLKDGKIFLVPHMSETKVK